jgi:hypothetical protein
MNLENLNVQEMSIKELTTTDGGGWFADLVEDVSYGVGYAVGVAVGTAVVAVHIVTDAIVEH